MALKLYKKCEFCRKQRLFWTVHPREVKIPQISQVAKSQKPMCNKCYNQLITKLPQ